MDQKATSVLGSDEDDKLPLRLPAGAKGHVEHAAHEAVHRHCHGLLRVAAQGQGEAAAFCKARGRGINVICWAVGLRAV